MLFAAAAKAGNPDSLIAFNPGVKVPVICHSEHEDGTVLARSADAFCAQPVSRPLARWRRGGSAA